jgi:hypothetical protein
VILSDVSAYKALVESLGGSCCFIGLSTDQAGWKSSVKREVDKGRRKANVVLIAEVSTMESLHPEMWEELKEVVEE